MSDLLKAYGHPIITGSPGPSPGVSKPKAIPGPGQSFAEMLEKTMTAQKPALVFSKHAQARTQQRNLSLSAADLQRLNQAVEKAQEKGLGDTLVLINGAAFIVNAQSRVVITVVDTADEGNTVVTNIEGAVIA